MQPRPDESDTAPAPVPPDQAVLEQLRIPTALRPTASEIIALTDAWCAAALDEQYAALTRQVTARLARKRPSPLERGRRRIWAAGVLQCPNPLVTMHEGRVVDVAQLLVAIAQRTQERR